MKFSDLYYTNNDWDSSTLLDIYPGPDKDTEQLESRKAMLKYPDCEVVGFGANWVVLRASD